MYKFAATMVWRSSLLIFMPGWPQAPIFLLMCTCRDVITCFWYTLSIAVWMPVDLCLNCRAGVVFINYLFIPHVSAFRLHIYYLYDFNSSLLKFFKGAAAWDFNRCMWPIYADYGQCCSHNFWYFKGRCHTVLLFIRWNRCSDALTHIVWS